MRLITNLLLSISTVLKVWLVIEISPTKNIISNSVTSRYQFFKHLPLLVHVWAINMKTIFAVSALWLSSSAFLPRTGRVQFQKNCHKQKLIHFSARAFSAPRWSATQALSRLFKGQNAVVFFFVFFLCWYANFHSLPHSKKLTHTDLGGWYFLKKYRDVLGVI